MTFRLVLHQHAIIASPGKPLHVHFTFIVEHYDVTVTSVSMGDE